MEKYVGMIEGVEVIRGTFQECVEYLSTWIDDGYTLNGDCGIIPAYLMD